MSDCQETEGEDRGVLKTRQLWLEGGREGGETREGREGKDLGEDQLWFLEVQACHTNLSSGQATPLHHR